MIYILYFTERYSVIIHYVINRNDVIVHWLFRPRKEYQNTNCFSRSIVWLGVNEVLDDATNEYTYFDHIVDVAILPSYFWSIWKIWKDVWIRRYFINTNLQLVESLRFYNCLFYHQYFLSIYECAVHMLRYFWVIPKN